LSLRARPSSDFRDGRPTSASSRGAGRISLCHRADIQGNYMRTRAARQHGIGEGSEFARTIVPTRSRATTSSCFFPGSSTAWIWRCRWNCGCPPRGISAESEKQPAHCRDRHRALRRPLKREPTSVRRRLRGKRALDWAYRQLACTGRAAPLDVSVAADMNVTAVEDAGRVHADRHSAGAG